MAVAFDAVKSAITQINGSEHKRKIGTRLRNGTVLLTMQDSKVLHPILEIGEAVGHLFCQRPR